MNAARTIMRMLLGRRLPTTSGRIDVPGLEARVSVRRDRYGIPHLDAESDTDAWFGLGFCLGQDRSWQIESLVRVVRGTVAELAGPQALPVDRMSRRLGFRRSAEGQLKIIDDDIRTWAEAYARGINAGRAHGIRRPAHEFTLLRTSPTPVDAADVLGIGAMFGIALVGWDAKLARMKIALADGVEALADLDAGYAAWLPVTDPPGSVAGPAVDRLADDLQAFSAFVGVAGGSNNWAVSATRTATGRPILANDPHLAPSLPSQWYLAHLHTPDWEVAGATFVGLPGFPAGHNDVAAWGISGGYVDNTDVLLEQIGPDGASVRRGDDWVACQVVRETIRVRGGDPTVEEVLLTPDGPIIGPALSGEVGAVSIRATWLQPRRIRATVGFHRIRDFDGLRRECAHWSTAGQNVVYADTASTIGWQLTGDAPRRHRGHGLLPVDAADPQTAWDGDVPFDEYPHSVDPEAGWIATANNKPVADNAGPYLGAGWVDGYRVAAIGRQLDARADWDVTATQQLQMDLTSLPWRELRGILLQLPGSESDSREALRLLEAWDGRVTADSPAAAVFELVLAELTDRIVQARAPHAAKWAQGRSFHPLAPRSYFSLKVSRLVQLLHEQPDGWFPDGWESTITAALGTAMARLRSHGGPPYRGWGDIRPMTLAHMLGQRRPLDQIFNLGPFPCGGDANTVAQCNGGLDGPAAFTATMRMVIDVGNWNGSRFSLSGGQSGNPLSAHYDDLHHHWRRGTGVPIAWTEQQVEAATIHTLHLDPTLGRE